MIIVTVPTSISFAINPNSASDPFISAPFSIENQSNSPVEVAFLGFKSDDSSSAKIVNEDKHPDWGKLSTSKSESEIALGINVDGNTLWSPAELEDQTPDTVVDTIKIDRLGLKVLNLDGRHGMSFSESKLMSYKMYIRVGLAS